MPRRYSIGMIIPLTVALSGSAVAVKSIAIAQSVEPSTITASTIQGGGSWKAERQQVPSGQQWYLDVARGDNDSIRGRITVEGSALFNDANVEGRIVGDRISGLLKDDDGNHIATFDGRISETGLSGTYTDRTNEVGEWSWEGPLPK